ncbi:hypothetical protein GCM10010464_35760 [Pseudonocardia yunnanensis]
MPLSGVSRGPLAGGPPFRPPGRAQVAEWAGHSVAVLLRVYAKCIAGQEDAARHRVALTLGLTRHDGSA